MLIPITLSSVVFVGVSVLCLTNPNAGRIFLEAIHANLRLRQSRYPR
jgi:hypothetical protein